MKTGLYFIATGIIMYVASYFIFNYYLNKNCPDVIEADLYNPQKDKYDEYLWEKTAGTGVMPKWVSLLNLLSIPVLAVGIIIAIIGLIF